MRNETNNASEPKRSASMDTRRPYRPPVVSEILHHTGTQVGTLDDGNDGNGVLCRGMASVLCS
jgi:hypothetical protein